MSPPPVLERRAGGVNRGVLYADSHRCPDCRAAVEGPTTTCPVCGLLLIGPVAIELFRTLRTVDELIARLRASSAPAGVTPGAPAAPAAPRTSPPSVAPAAAGDAPRPVPYTPYPVAPAPAKQRRGMLEVGVPQLLLGLGAACLLVGSLVFLAIAWVLMGVGGRTAVLCGLTTAAAIGTYVAARRPLRAAAEAFGAVTAGMVLLVLGGASAAGWFGDAGVDALVTTMGAALIGVGVGATLLMRATPMGRLVSGEIAACLGALLVSVGVTFLAESGSVGLSVGTALLLALGLGARACGHRVLVVAAAATGSLLWTGLLAAGTTRVLEDSTPTSLWVHFDLWPLLAATALAAIPALVGTLPRAARLIAAAGSGAAAVIAAVAPLGLTTDAGVVAWSLVLLGLAAAAHVLTTWRPALAGPGLVAGIAPLVVVADILSTGAANVATLRRPAAADIRIDALPGLLDQPWIAVIAAVGISAAVAAALAQHLPAARGDRGGVLLSVLTAVAVTAMYDVPLAVVVAELAVCGAALVALALLRPAHEAALPAWFVALTAFALAVAAAVPSDALLALALTPALAALALALTWGAAHRPLVVVSECATPVVAAAWVVVLGAVAGLAAEPVRVAALLAVALLFAVPGRRVMAASGAVVAVGLTALVATGDHQAAWLTVHLTLAGAAAGAAALLHAGWRRLAWVGGALLVLASWVRLDAAQVTTPEAYTLPAALTLLTLGVLALRRDPERSTASALLSGLVLALMPSTVVALQDPASARGLLLGLAALLLVLAGAALRWSAPLIAGAVVGALLLLRAVAPYAALIPPYAVILAAGAILVTVGVTWEARLASLRRTQRYVARLR